VEQFAALSLALVGIVTLAVGIRLLVRAAQTRGLPELLFGLGFVFGTVGVVGSQLGQRLIWTDPSSSLAAIMTAITFASQVVGTVALYAVVWRVFRPGPGGWGAAAFAAGSLIAIGAWLLRLADGDFSHNLLDTRSLLIFQLTRVALFTWSSAEGLGYAARMRKQISLGLGDVATHNQIFFWGAAGVLMVFTTLLIIIPIFVMGMQSPLDHPVTTVLVTGPALFTSLFIWWAFFPPAGMKDRLVWGAAS
jgi:hypothetical protein